MNNFSVLEKVIF